MLLALAGFGAALGTPSVVADSSRYAGIGTATYPGPDGQPIVYLLRRFVPHPESLATLGYHTVTGGERLDRIAAVYLGDPELFWRICDGNRAIRPDELTETVGRVLRITLAEGVPETNTGG
jgi:hypothetical protein